MPRLRRRLRKFAPADVADHHLEQLRTGFALPILPHFATEADMLAAWTRLGPELRARWAEEYPGERVWADEVFGELP